MEGEFYEGAVSFLSALDEQLPITEEGSKAYSTAHQAVIDTLADNIRENYARYQKLAFYHKYIDRPTEPLVLGYNRILARMVGEKADKVAAFQTRDKKKR